MGRVPDIQDAPPDLSPSAERLIVLLAGSALLINNFDLGIFALALPQIQASLGIPESGVGLFTGLLRLGALLAFPLTFLADKVGRRQILLVTIVGMTAATIGSAFAQTAPQFLTLQVLARCFGYAEDMLCYVIVAEEVAASRRGLALGRMAALGACGYGLSALLYGAVDLLPHGWRDLYLIGAAGLALLALLRTRLGETRRFIALRGVHKATPTPMRNMLAPLVSLLKAHPKRFVGLVCMTAPFWFGVTSATALLSKHLQADVGFTQSGVGMMYLLGGAVSVLGYFLAGRISDVVGRRLLLTVSIIVAAGLLALLYSASNPMLIVPCWIGAMFMVFASEVTIAAFASELFPTSFRATAAGARVTLNVAAALAGLACESALFGALGAHVPAVIALLAVAPLALLSIWFLLPETATRNLEDISPEIGRVLRSDSK
ncbi:MAG: MFS transporter [Terricaulis sp.]